MGRHTAILLVGSALVLLGPASAAAAPGDDAVRRKEAQQLFEKGVKLDQSGDSKAALSSFRSAYDRYPSFRVLYNIGKLCARMGDNACAVRAYEKYLRDGGADVPAKRREGVESDVRSLARTLGSLTIRANVIGGDVTVDDEPAGRTPIAEPVTVNAGAHKVVLVVPSDKRTVEQTVKVAAGESATVQLDVPLEEGTAPAPVVVPVPGAVVAPPAEPKTEPPPVAAAPGEPRKVPVIPWVVTGVLAASTLVTGILASSAYGDYKDKRDAFPVTRSELDDAQGSARTLFIVTGVLGGATLVSAGVASYLTFFTGPRSRVGIGFGAPGVALGAPGFSIAGVIP